MTQTATCAIVGCEREVPRHEWPADRTFPKVCDPCLRAATAPMRPTAPAPVIPPVQVAEEDVSADFD